MRKNIKELFSITAIAICLGLLLSNFVISTSKVQAFDNSEYKENDRLIVNKITNNYKVGDMIQFKQNNTNYIRRIVKINNNVISVCDKNNTISTINIKDIAGKVIYKF